MPDRETGWEFEGDGDIVRSDRDYHWNTGCDSKVVNIARTSCRKGAATLRIRTVCFCQPKSVVGGADGIRDLFPTTDRTATLHKCAGDRLASRCISHLDGDRLRIASG